MNSFSELAKIRRSHRVFTDESVSEEELNFIMKSALMAPSSKGLHSYEFMVVTDKGKLQSLSICKAQGAELVSGASAAIIVMGDPNVSDCWIEDASAATTIMLLQIEDLGLGACWVQVRDRKDKDGNLAENNVRELLSIPDNMRVLCIVAVGHKGSERKPQNEERLKWDKVHRETWK